MTKELEALKRIRQETCPATYMDDFDKNECCDVIEQALINYTNITKQIEEADYKSAIGLLVKVKDNLNSYTYNTILEALLKTQEPKHYLKWEDLEFDDKEQRMDVSLNGHPHLLCYYRTLFGSLCMIDNTGITIREDNKYFFNDLHLERVEE